MKVREAKEIARDWLAAEGAALSGFCGAFFAGSVNWMAPDEVFPPGSDLDIFIIVDREDIGTLRTRKEVFAKYGELPMQERFLRLLGVETIPLAEAGVCLDECIAVLDRAIEFHRTSCEGDNFVSRASRELLIRGVEEMFGAGYHREVINFIDMVFYISLSVIVRDAPEGVRREADGLFRQYMRHHGISREEEHLTRIELARTGLDELMACAERIIRANPSARD